MSQTLVAISGFSIALAAIFGAFRFRQIGSGYYSFIILAWIALANETISFLLIRAGHSNAVNSNIYVLLESLLILYFFHEQGLLRGKTRLVAILWTGYIVLWITENFFLSSLNRFHSYFIIAYSFITVLLSINQVNRLISSEKGMLLRNACFLICIGFILFNTCKVLIEIFWVYGLNASREFRIQVYRIMAWVNLLVNLIFAIAVLWIPRKREYTLL